MRQSIHAIGLATLAVLASSSVHAQSPGITLGVDSGSVLVSTGGEFTQASPGQAVLPGHRVLVSEGASATLNYADGCRRPLAIPGVHTVSGECAPADSSRSTRLSTGAIVGIVGGVVVVAAAAGGGGGSDGPPPVSR